MLASLASFSFFSTHNIFFIGETETMGHLLCCCPDDEDDFFFFVEFVAKDRTKVEECTVCLEPLYTFCRLPCTHTFHARCMEQWLIEHDNNSCPVCRFPVYLDDDEESSSSEEGL